MISTVRLKTFQVIELPLEVLANPTSQQECASFDCDLQWRQKQLWVKPLKTIAKFILPALNNKQWLTDCLKQSSVKLICLDPDIGESGIRRWADACQQADKQVFLRIRSNFQTQNGLSWWLKRSLDWLVAMLLLLILSPLMLGIALLIGLTSPGPILFRQWRVGARGKLFKIYKFRTMIVDAEKLHHQTMGHQTGLHKCQSDPRITSVGRWLRRYSLDELPQLFNVLLGEMSLVGPRPWALYDALRIDPAQQKRLNALPGITGPWQVIGRSSLLDLETVTHCDLNYLSNWSIGKDLLILVMTVPRVISGFGAY